MKIYLKVKKDNAYCVASLWSKHIKEQILETVEEVSQNWMFEPKLYPMFYQEDTHSHFVEANNERFFFEWLMYELCFVWELNDFEGYEDEYSDFARERDVFLDKDKVEPPKEYVYIGSYIYEQEEPLTLPGLVFDPEYAEDDGEVLAECMFTSDFEDEKLKRAYMSNGNDEECEKDTPAL